MAGDRSLPKGREQSEQAKEPVHDSSGGTGSNGQNDGASKVGDQSINNSGAVKDGTEKLRKESLEAGYQIPKEDPSQYQQQSDVYGGMVGAGYTNRLYDLNDEQVKAYATQIKEALNRKQFEEFGQKLGDDNPDVDKIANLLSGLKFADRQAIEWEVTKDLNKEFNKDFRQVLADKVNGKYESIGRISSILDCPDNNKGDYKGNLETAFGRLTDAGSALEQRRQPNNLALETYIMLSPVIKAGKDAVDQFQNCEDARKRSEAEKEILGVLGHMDSGDIKFANNQNIVDKIAHSPYLSDAGKAAICVLMRGKDNWANNDTACGALADIGLEQQRPDIFRTAIESSSKLRESFNTDAGMQKIDKAFSNESDRQDAKDYVKWGSTSLDRDLANYIHPWNKNRLAVDRRLDSLTPDEKAFYKAGHELSRNLSERTPLEQQQLKYYMTVRQKLVDAAESPSQFKEWEGKLLGNDYKPSALETLQENHENFLDDAGTLLTNKNEKAGKKIDALINMSDEEKELCKQDPSHFLELDKAIDQELKPGSQRKLAHDILKRISNGGTSTLSPSEQVQLDNIKGTDGIEAIRHIEKALSDPKMLQSIQSPENIDLKKEFQQSMKRVAENAAFSSLVGYGLTDSFTSGKLVNSVFKDGHVDIRLKLAVKPDTQLSIAEILAAPKEVKDKLAANSNDERTKRLQDIVLGNTEQREFIQSVLNKKDSAELSPIEMARAYSLNLGITSEQLKTTFEKLPPEAIAKESNKYFEKYQTLLNNDVFYRLQGEQLPKGEQAEFRELLSHTEIAPTQKMLNTMAEHYKDTSVFDPAIDALWDGSKKDSAEYNRRVELFLAKHGNHLTDEEKTTFINALDKFRAAEENYKHSKAEFADALSDSTMTLAAVTGSLFAPAVSIPLLAATGAGGALYNIGLKRAIVGEHFDTSSASLKKEGFRGASTAMLGIVGPQNLGLGKELFALAKGSTPTIRARAAHEMEQLLRSTYTGAVSSGGTEIAAVGVGIEKPENLGRQLPGALTGGAIGAAGFHGVFKGVGVGGHGALKAFNHFRGDVSGTVMPRKPIVGEVAPPAEKLDYTKPATISEPVAKPIEKQSEQIKPELPKEVSTPIKSSSDLSRFSYDSLTNQMAAKNLTPESILKIPELAKSGAKNAPIKLGEGGNADVYEIPGLNDFVLRVNRSVGKPEISGKMSSVDGLPDLNVGQPIAEVAPGYTILKRQEGITSGLLDGRTKDWTAESDKAYAERRQMAAQMPQEAYNQMAQTLDELHNRNYSWDAGRALNVLIDSENKKFNLVDCMKRDSPPRQPAVTDLISPLIDNNRAMWVTNPAANIDSNRQIILKAFRAAEANNLPIDVDKNSTLAYSFKLAGMEDLLGKGNKLSSKDIAEYIQIHSAPKTSHGLEDHETAAASTATDTEASTTKESAPEKVQEKEVNTVGKKLADDLQNLFKEAPVEVKPVPETKPVGPSHLNPAAEGMNKDGMKNNRIGYNENGWLNRVFDKEGKVIRRLEYTQTEDGKYEIRTIKNKDGTILSSHDGYTWKVDSVSGKPPSGYPEIIQGHVQTISDGTTIISNPDQTRRFSADGTCSVTFAKSDKISYTTDKFMRVTDATNAAGDKLNIEYGSNDYNPAIKKVTSNKGDVYELVPGTTPDRNYYVHSKDGKHVETLNNIEFDKNGSFHKQGIREHKIIKLDGSIDHAIQLNNKDGLILSSQDDYNWKVLSSDGKPSTDYPETLQGQVQTHPDGSTQIRTSDKISNFSADGTCSVALANYLPKVSYKTDKFMRVTETTNVNGNKLHVEYTTNGDNHTVKQVTSNTGDIYELIPGVIPEQNYYLHSKNGEFVEQLKNIKFDKDGSLHMEGTKGHQIIKLDGSIVDGVSLITKSVNAAAEKQALFMRSMTDAGRDSAHKGSTAYSQTWQRLIHYTSDFEALSKKHNMNDQIGLVYHEVNELLSAEKAILPYEQRLVLAEQLMRNAAKPFDVDQGAHNTCNVSTVSIRMYAKDPAQIARLVKQATTTGEITLADGKKVKLQTQEIHIEPESQKHREVEVLARSLTSTRSHLNQIIQNTLVNTHWQTYELNASYPAGSIRYEVHAPTATNGSPIERLIDTRTGESLKKLDGTEYSSPYISGSEYEKLYAKITGKEEQFYLLNRTALSSEQLAPYKKQEQLFASPDEMRQCMQNLHPSEANPIILRVNSNAEPFFRDSGSWLSKDVAGGSGGWHVICGTGISEKNGKYFVHLDNTWGPDAQHKATATDQGEPVPLERLYFATLDAQLPVRLKEMEPFLTKDPIIALDYIRQKRFADKEMAKLTDLSIPANKTKHDEYVAMGTFNRDYYGLALNKLEERVKSGKYPDATADEVKYIHMAITQERHLIELEKYAEEKLAAPKQTAEQIAEQKERIKRLRPGRFQ